MVVVVPRHQGGDILERHPPALWMRSATLPLVRTQRAKRVETLRAALSECLDGFTRVASQILPVNRETIGVGGQELHVVHRQEHLKARPEHFLGVPQMADD